MGTNYYAIENACGCCGRYDEVHICKSMISFEAYIEWDQNDNPVITVGSWAEWKQRLWDKASSVVDDYGGRYTVDAFIAVVEDTALLATAEQRRSQFEWCLVNEPSSVSAGPEVDKTWLDPEGFTFTARPFT